VETPAHLTFKEGRDVLSVAGAARREVAALVDGLIKAFRDDAAAIVSERERRGVPRNVSRTGDVPLRSAHFGGN
jgi:hypothetical protein